MCVWPLFFCFVCLCVLCCVWRNGNLLDAGIVLLFLVCDICSKWRIMCTYNYDLFNRSNRNCKIVLWLTTKCLLLLFLQRCVCCVYMSVLFRSFNWLNWFVIHHPSKLHLLPSRLLVKPPVPWQIAARISLWRVWCSHAASSSSWRC